MPKPWFQHRAWTSCESCNGFGTPSQTCAEHAMASVHRSHGCIIGDGDMCGSYNGSSMPEPWFHNRFLELNYVHPVCRYSGIVFFYRFCLVVCSRFLQTGAAKGKACHKASEFSDHSLSLLLLDRSRRCCLSLQHYRVHADEDPQWLLEHGDGLLDLCAHRLEPYMGRVFMIFA